MRSRWMLALSLGLVLLVCAVAWSSAQGRSDPPGPVRDRAFVRAEMRVTNANVPMDEVLSLLPHGPQLGQFMRHQGPDARAYIDPRSGLPSDLQLSVPTIPGNGKGNSLRLEDVGRALGRPVREVDPDAVGDSIRKFLDANRDALGFD